MKALYGIKPENEWIHDKYLRNNNGETVQMIFIKNNK